MGVWSYHHVSDQVSQVAYVLALLRGLKLDCLFLVGDFVHWLDERRSGATYHLDEAALSVGVNHFMNRYLPLFH